MKPIHLLILPLLGLILQVHYSYAHNAHSHEGHKHSGINSISFISNQNQWDENVLYKATIGGVNTVFLEENAFTYVFYDETDVSQLHGLSQASKEEQAQFCLNAHAYQVEFLNALVPFHKGLDKRSEYHNYFLGKDSNKWAGNVPIFKEVLYNKLYDGIDLRAYSQYGLFKYDFIVSAQADASQIQLKYTGQDRIQIHKGHLIISTSAKTIIEQKPYAYQIIGGKTIEVPCSYLLNHNCVSFEFPEGYDSDYELIIDPVLVAATLSGTTMSNSTGNFGHTAAFDELGNIYTGGISFNSIYPITTGAFQTNFGGGSVDIFISKFNPDGSALIYATFVGGENREFPHSLFIDQEEQVYIYGTSNSFNYPTTENAYDTLKHNNYDLIVSVLSSDGSALIGSTFIGGDGKDGHNYASPNHGDTHRGEIIVDLQHNIYVASCTPSHDFPISSNALQDTIKELQDGVVFKMNSDVSQLEWSTFLGSSGIDMCYGLRLDPLGNIFVCGTAGNDDFPSVSGGLYENHLGGKRDAFIAHLSSDGSTLLNSTFWGTENLDIAFFIDLDNEGDVVIFGQSLGEIEHFPSNVYSQPNSTQFISGFTKDLSELKFSTTVGGNKSGNIVGGSLTHGMAPVAFMVDNCNYIYFSGYDVGDGLETSPDALFTSSCSDCQVYLGVLEEQASGLFYATYYTGDHVDGGTSRFDENGIVYQGLCNCNADFSTTPNAYSSTQANNCDAAVFKIDFQTPGANAVVSTESQVLGCAPLMVGLSSQGSKGQNYNWNFDDGSYSTENNPTHTFQEPGTFNIQLIANDPNSCNLADTAYLEIVVFGNVTNNTSKLLNICDNNFITMEVTEEENATYEWNDGFPGSSYTTNLPGIYWVTTSIDDCEKTDTFVINDEINNLSLDLGPDLVICEGEDLVLDASNIPGDYLWQNSSTDPNMPVTQSGIYWVEIDIEGCVKKDSVEVEVVPKPNIDFGGKLHLCQDEFIELFAPISSNPGIAYTYEWQDGSSESSYMVEQSGTYTVDISYEDCTKTETVVVEISPPLPVIDLGPDFQICKGESVTLEVPDDGNIYEWQDGSIGNSFTIDQTGDYSVKVSNSCGTVEDEISIFVNEYLDVPNPVLMPSGFTPNGDGLNDVFKPQLSGLINDYQFIVYNRWGQIIFETKNPDVGWTGFSGRTEAQMGVYVWICSATVDNCKGRENVFHKGNVTLIK